KHLFFIIVFTAVIISKPNSKRFSYMKGSLFIVTAASGTGKTSLVKQLIATTNDLAVSVSHTTRDPRPGEVDGQHYHFTDTTKFVEGIQAGEFLEHAQVFDNYYGTSRQSVDQQLNSGV